MLKIAIRKLRNFINIFRLVSIDQYFGFVQGHFYLNGHQILMIKNLIGKTNHESIGIVAQFESLFSSFVGGGESVSFAAARMAFFSLMKELKIGEGDEVILQAANCSVMANAVWRTGATPVFADIDLDTFGSSQEAIRKKITIKTKMIVAQHSFGIPCKIDSIVKLSKEKDIFLLEDCALSLGSTIYGISVGNWGDAALFSTDHSKPINTFIGGLIYSKDAALIKNIKEYRDTLENLSTDHQKLIFKQLMFERKYYNPKKLGLGGVMSYFKVVLQKLKILNESVSVLTDDYIKPDDKRKSNYPYPSKFPAFLAKAGIYELERWNEEKKARITLFKSYFDLCIEHEYGQFLPKAYFDDSLQIVPLRFVFNQPNAINLRVRAKKYLDINGFWFLKPIVACDNPTELGYVYGSCMNAEKLGKEVINFPCVLDHFYDSNLLEHLKHVLSTIR